MNAHQPPAFDVEKRIAQAVQLRDEIEAQEKAHKERMKPFKETYEKLTGRIMQHLLDTKTDSAKTAAGTAFLSSKKSASLEDPEAFMNFVTANDAWDLLDRKANATAVADFIEEHNAPPPGVKFSVMQTLNVRRK